MSDSFEMLVDEDVSLFDAPALEMQYAIFSNNEDAKTARNNAMHRRRGSVDS